MSNSLYVGRDGKVNEKAIYRDAWRIAEPGAANPVAVARTLHLASAALLHDIGTDIVKKHPALRLMAGQLSYLFNVSALGADEEDYAKVKTVLNKIESGAVDICFVCGAYNDFPCIDQHKNSHGGKLNQTDHARRPNTMPRRMDRDFRMENKS